MAEEEKNTIWVRDLAFQLGTTLFGIANIRHLKDQFLLSREELEGMEYGISLGLVLSYSVLNGITDRPTLLYKWHYRQANNLLDKIAFILSMKIEEKKYRALPIPASQIVNWKEQKGHVSHRTIGAAAGLGWRGKNNLLVNNFYGSQFRLVTILTDLPLNSDSDLTDKCGTCNKCVVACPAGALGENAKEYNFEKCYEMLKGFSKIKGIGQYICGVCVRTCNGRRHN
jgi:epoxyqueuosine reductase QueG